MGEVALFPSAASRSMGHDQHDRSDDVPQEQAAPNTAGPTLGEAVTAFFAEADLAANSRRAYAATYRALTDRWGENLALREITGERLRALATECWADAAPTTWNARLTALQSFTAFCRRCNWLDDDPVTAVRRRRVPRDASRSISCEELAALWSHPDAHLRERLFWRCLYATAARAGEILSLDIEDLDLARKRAIVTGKGGHREAVVWDTATARLFPRYLAGRTQGPVFVTHGKPNCMPTEENRAPDGRARLSYQRAWSIFREASAGRWTLHQLRHSALTHLGEKGVGAPLLMAKSRHRDPRTLSRYVQPGVEAVAALTAAHDPARRPKH